MVQNLSLQARGCRRSWVMRCVGALACLVALVAMQSNVARAADEPAAEAEAAPEAAGEEHVGEEHAGEGHAGEDHGHHDESDLSHANAGAQLESPAEWRFELAIFSFVVFLLLLAVLLKFAWRPIMQGLERRENAIATMIEEAKQNQVAAAKQLQEYEARLDRAAEEARVIVSQAHDDAQAAADQIRKDARAEADRERQRALADIQAAKNAALDDLTQRSVDLALGLAGNIVRKQLNSDDHAQLIRDYLEELPNQNLTNNN